MTSALPKENSMTQYPKYFITTIASVLLLAIFLFLASSLLVSQPIGFTVRNYFYGIASSQNFDLASSFNDSVVDRVETEGQRDSTELDRSGTNDGKDGSLKSDGEGDGKKDVVLKEIQIPDVDSPNVDKSVNSPSNVTSGDSTTTTNVNYESNVPSSYGIVNNASLSEDTEKRDTDSTDSDCDLYHGKWVYDSAGPLYTNNSCPVLSQMQNCQGNGRPDKDYENWRWKPNQCDLPRFDPRKFLKLMRGKTLAYIGDSVSRNQMESMLCILWQAEEPQDRGTKKMRRYFFNSTSTTIVRIWSSWLVHQTTEPFDYAPANVTKLHLDAPDEGFMEYIKEFDVIVFSSGHWFVKPSVYILNNEIVGGQLWWPDKSKKMEVNNIEAFGISVETIFSSMVTNANYSGLTIVRSYSPDHYEGGAWNTGGSCTGKDKPATDSELVENEFTNIMHEKQVTGFNRAIKKQTNKSILKYMDITNVFSYRRDGHPGPYRNTDPNKITKRGPDGRPPPQDCLHWCMPGPIDTWNELVFEIIQQEFKHKEASS